MSETSTGNNDNSQTIELQVVGKTLVFTVTRADYNRYINAVMPTSKVAPAHNFCIATVVPDSLPELKRVLQDNAGAEIHIAAAILEEYMPDLEITAKKRSSAPQLSAGTDTTS